MPPWRLFICGLCIGAADLIPGISGGTIALVLGLYEGVLSALRSIDLRFFKRLGLGQWRLAFSSVPWSFLLSLSFGIGTALVTLVHVIRYLLSQPNERSLLYGAFTGLVLGSAWIMCSRIRCWNLQRILICGIATALAFLLSTLTPIDEGSMTFSPLWIFICGIIGICAALLPGISGSYCLNVLGTYPAVIAALAELSSALGNGFIAWEALKLLILLLMGALTGGVIFSRTVSWALSQHHDTTMAAMVGFMLGTLQSVWPFSATLALNFEEAMTWWILGCLLMGFSGVIALDRRAAFARQL